MVDGLLEGKKSKLMDTYDMRRSSFFFFDHLWIPCAHDSSLLDDYSPESWHIWVAESLIMAFLTFLAF